VGDDQVTAVGIVTGAGRGMGRACAEHLLDLVDVLIAVDLEEDAAAACASDLTGLGRAVVEPFALDVTDRPGLERLAARVEELGPLRAVAHAAGVSPTMGDWRRVIMVDLVGTALLVEVLRPLATVESAFVCFASMAPYLAGGDDPRIDEVLGDPLHESFLNRLEEAVGPGIQDPGLAYSWAKRGVHLLVQQEAVRLGPLGARICSVSPGIIDTPQGRQEAASKPAMQALVDRTPLGRQGRSEELAAVSAFLLSSAASFVTGIDVLVDGGVCASVRQLAVGRAL
jgi:NAD(P)-dependent dehydrogenase (short-subunit alcohol dehydrogenase family)